MQLRSILNTLITWNALFDFLFTGDVEIVIELLDKVLYMPQILS